MSSVVHPINVQRSGIRRWRDAVLVEKLIEEAALHGTELTEEICHNAIAKTWQNGACVKPARALAIVRKKLRNPNIRRALQDVYQGVADFSVIKAISKHVEHIEGAEYEKTFVTKNGEVIKETVRDKPSWPALKAYLEMALPQPAKKVQMDITAHHGQSMLSDVPPIEARALGPARVEPEPDALTVEFEEDASDG